MVDEMKPVKIWVDGCFDMMHFGHANLLRQARELGDYLVVGVHSDADIMTNKGIPVMNEQERYAAVRACKWADEVVEGAPYTTDLEIMDKYGCQYCVHGDDLVTTADGTDTYGNVKAANRFKEVPRTIGVSTTELVGRMLLMTRDHHETPELPSKKCRLDNESEEEAEKKDEEPKKKSPYTAGSKMMPSNHRLVQFSQPIREPKKGDKIVYVDGGFDLFHIGHAELFKLAKEKGDYLLVGIHDDQTINRIKGANYPLMNLQERVLSVLACKWVDEVVIGAPYSISKAMIQDGQRKIDVVVHGKTESLPDLDGSDPYAVPKEMGIYEEVDTKLPEMTSDRIITRILAHRGAFEERNRKKEAKEISQIASIKQATQVQDN